jgi:hypothetical protein
MIQRLEDRKIFYFKNKNNLSNNIKDMKLEEINKMKKDNLGVIKFFYLFSKFLFKKIQNF